MASAWRVAFFQLRERPFHESIKIGYRTKLNVPVRSGGQGILVIGSDNDFGYRPAPRLGTGEILLQPRTKQARLTIGSSNRFSNNVSIIAAEEIRVGNGCRIGDQVSIYDCDFHEIDPSSRDRSIGSISPVLIGDNGWLGSRGMVLKRCPLVMAQWSAR